MDFNPECGYIADMVYEAIRIGYRHFDTAWIYTTEKQIAVGVKRAIDEGLVKRSDLFLSTKIFMTAMHAEDLLKQAQQSLANLRHEYIDLLLLHGPVPLKDSGSKKFGVIPVKEDGSLSIDTELDVHTESWSAMEQLVDVGAVMSIGVANYDVSQLRQTIAKSRIKPAVNQVECNLLLQQQELVQFCKEQGILLVAHTPLGGQLLPPETKVDDFTHNPIVNRNQLWDNESVKSIAAKHQKSVAQVMLRFQVDRGVAVIPKTRKRERLIENADIFDFELDAEDDQTLRKLDSGRHCVSEFFASLNRMPL